MVTVFNREPLPTSPRTFTVTVYSFTEPSSAVTVKVLASPSIKSTCSPDAGVIVAPSEIAIFGMISSKDVPKGTLTVILVPRS